MPRFDLAIADEAHRTMGTVRADRKTDFRNATIASKIKYQYRQAKKRQVLNR